MPFASAAIEFAAAPAADVSRGAFESLLVVEGRALDGARHLARLAASARALDAGELEPGLPALVAEAASRHPLARLRVELADGRVAVQAQPLAAAVVLPEGEVDLVAVRVAAGFGAHKLVDRGWLDAIEAAAQGARAVLVAADETVLETTRANVFAVRDGELATPPLNGRILPGIMRATVLDGARRERIPVRERALTIDELRDADDVLLTNSVRLLERARLRADARSDEVVARLYASLAALAA